MMFYVVLYLQQAIECWMAGVDSSYNKARNIKSWRECSR